LPKAGARFAPKTSIISEEEAVEAVEIIGVILVGIIIGLLGKFIAPGTGTTPRSG
jgi:hypothetical protein